MQSPADMKRHLSHRLSILKAFITERRQVNRDSFNCYTDATMITCRSLWGLLGVTLSSRGETDMVSPTKKLFRFDEFTNEIRPSIDPSVKIKAFSQQAELDALPEINEILRVLAAANKCVAHFANLLDHSVDEHVLELVAKRTMREVNSRIAVP